MSNESSPKHPYSKYENTAQWRLINKTLSELEQNQDIKLNAPGEYVIGYICQQIDENNALQIHSSESNNELGINIKTIAALSIGSFIFIGFSVSAIYAQSVIPLAIGLLGLILIYLIWFVTRNKS